MTACDMCITGNHDLCRGTCGCTVCPTLVAAIPLGCERLHGHHVPPCGPDCWLAQRDPGDPADEADEAVRYVLDRAQRDADLGYLIGPFMQAFALLCAAEAARTGETPAEVEARRAISLTREPRRYLSRGEWRDRLDQDRREAT